MLLHLTYENNNFCRNCNGKPIGLQGIQHFIMSLKGVGLLTILSQLDEMVQTRIIVTACYTVTVLIPNTLKVKKKHKSEKKLKKLS